MKTMKMLLSSVLIGAMLVVVGCGGDVDDRGPVAADQAQIEIAFTDDGTSFVGDHEIAEGAVTFTFSNETESASIVAVLRYETGSAALAEELDRGGEGNLVVTSEPPTAGFSEVDFEGSGDPVLPGSHAWTMDLGPGTYLFDVGHEDFHATGLWRAAVIEVIAR